MSDNVYSLNPHPLSGEPLTPQEYHKAIYNWAIIVVAIAIALGLWYWWSVLQTSSPSVQTDPQAAARARVAAILREASVQPTQAQIDSVTSALSSSKSAPTNAQVQAVAAQLHSSVSEQ
ncbi:MAG: hypothetical protein KGI49_03260 [Patescibacteria group bacterium]|nr:hypothetical protein [Patescibacteria group bacterium]